MAKHPYFEIPSRDIGTGTSVGMISVNVRDDKCVAQGQSFVGLILRRFTRLTKLLTLMAEADSHNPNLAKPGWSGKPAS